MKKLISIVGARPQFIKAAVVSRAIATLNEESGNQLAESIVHTGQHFDPQMSRIFFEEMEILDPAVHLGIACLPHGAMTGRMIETIEEVLLADKPSVVLVYGDTNTTLAATVAASKLHVPIAHVEAGLRSFNRKMPEEINRVLTDHASDFLFAPTRVAADNLRREGFDERRIHCVGDVMYDASLFYAQRARRTSTIRKRLDLSSRKYVLATIHRQENTDDPIRLQVIFEAFARIARDTRVILPLHPRTRSALLKLPASIEPSRLLEIIEPVGYLDMVALEEHAVVIATDSGGVQKEAYFYGVPCVTLRDETEWVELVEIGANVLAPPHNPEVIVDAITAALASSRRAKGNKLYGTGDEGEKIVGI
ncbi:MAG: non-hydrolyzing UDP-N-acetylglucosamine 2-epimerase, partial [Pyrinomonadaceae bacterium]